MLRLLDWLEESNERGPWYAQQRRQVLKFIRFQRAEEDGGGGRRQRALSMSEANQLMDVWAHDERPVALRNTAMLRLMVYTGLRRAELVVLRWEDINLENQTVRVRYGKGDKERVVSIADITNVSKRVLEALRAGQRRAIAGYAGAGRTRQCLDHLALCPGGRCQGPARADRILVS